MTLQAGTRLGPYEILSPLGAGGMGEVYRARDTRLGRDVAIKVLPQAWAADPERLRRFEGEARAASALSDPHIVAVFDVGTAGGVQFFATELVDGTDLRAQMGDPMPVRKVLDLAEQVASGLAAAHEKGIVHRDLKPENVLVTRKGFAKVADFGLAKLTEAGGASGSQVPTSDGVATAPGIVMGTVAYMSPEQARGAAVDFRSDQFALGAILWEMLTGRTAFRRASTAETLAAILREDPEPLATAASGTPPPLRWLVERCLAKDPGGRYASTSDLHRELESIRDHLSETVSGPAAAAPAAAEPKRRSRILAGAALVAALAAGAMLAKIFWKPPPREPPAYDQVTFQTGNIWNARFAPDGKTILYSARVKGGPRRTYMTRTDSTDSTELAWPEGTVYSISSTGQVALGVMHHPATLATMLTETTLAGGAPRQILDGVVDADWSPDGAELAVVHQVAGRGRVEYPIGNVLFDPGPAASVDALRFSPDGKRLAIVVTHGSEASLAPGTQSVEVSDVGRRKTSVLASGWQTLGGLAWNPSGREIWFSARPAGAATGTMSVHAVDLSGNVHVITRTPGVLLLEDVFRDGRVLVSQNFWPSSIVFRAPRAAAETDLSWHEDAVATDLSADGATMLLTEAGIRQGATGATLLRKTDSASPPVRLGAGRSVRLSPDGKWAVALSADPQRAIVLLPTGAGQEINLTAPGVAVSNADWFPDSRRLLLFASDPGHPTPRIFEQPISGGPPRPSPVRATSLGRISPDGRAIAAHGPSGTIEIFPLDGGPSRPVANTAPNDQIVRWSGDGSALFVRTGTAPAHLFRLDVRTGKRDLLADLGPADRAGVLFIQGPLVTADGKGYSYSYGRYLNNLYVVTGLR